MLPDQQTCSYVMSNFSVIYSIKKSILGSFHQGDARFGSTRGTQCACNALFAICWSVIRKVSLWKTADLDHILIEGDKVYKSLNVLDFLAADQLPNVIIQSGRNFCITIDPIANETIDLVFQNGFLNIMQVYCNANGFLLFISGYTIALILLNDKFYIFDSHSRNERGLTVFDGKSVLLTFSNLHQLENYIQVCYLQCSNRDHVFLQLQPVIVRIGSDDCTYILNCYKNLQRRVTYMESIGTPKHEKLRQAKRKKERTNYAKIIGSDKHNEIKSYKRKKSKEAYTKSLNTVYEFKKQVREGPFYICSICNRCLYRRSVLKLDETKYQHMRNIFTNTLSFDKVKYICQTCESKLKKSKMPCQAVSNKLELFDLPNNLKSLRKLERVLVSILFKKIAIMPKGQSPKMKGNICNVPIDVVDTCNSLPRASDSNGLLIVKLKRKAEFRGHVLFEPVRPNFVLRVLEYLKQNNPLYHDIEINISSIPNNLKVFQDNVEKNELVEQLIRFPEDELKIIVEKESDEIECMENPLDEYRTPANETALIAEIPSLSDVEESISLSPGEGKIPVSPLNDQFCEELAHPHLFPTGRFGYKIKREVPLSASKYFNQRLLNYTQKFASDSDYIFYAHSVLQRLQLNNQINIAMRKITSTSLTAGTLSNNFKETIKQFVANDKAFRFMTPVKGTHAYWKKFLNEVLAMVKQLGIPTFFLTLTCADLRWNELISIIFKLKGTEVSENDINKMSYHDRCDALNSNPVLVARHFQYRVEVFYKTIILNGPLGNTNYYVIRVEFQVRGSPHIHSFIWIKDAPKLTCETKNEYILWLDSIVRADLPNYQNEPELYQLVKTYQIHRHFKTCHKYKNEKCRFRFGKYFTDETIVAEPLPENISEQEKLEIMQKRNKVLETVKKYIDTELNPCKKNFFDHTKEDFEPCNSIREILNSLNISENEYKTALSISDDKDFQIHIKRPPNSCFVNNYFRDGLLAWEANLDIQPVFNHYKAIAYLCAYLSKNEDETTVAMKQAVEDAFEKKLDNYDQMKAIAHAYTSKRECSVQECVYQIMSGQWLRKTYPAVIFANSNLPENRFRMCLSEKELFDLPADSTNIFKRNMIDRYCDRPNSHFASGKYAILDSFCFAEFLRYYYLRYNENDENDYQPDELRDELIESNHEMPCSTYPKVIPLMSSKEKLYCRKIAYVLRYYTPNKELKPELYAHHLLFMFYPFRNEEDLKCGNPPSYIEKISEPGINETINNNRQLLEPYAELVDIAFERLRSDLEANIDPFGQQENCEVEESLLNQSQDENTEEEECVQSITFHDPLSSVQDMVNDTEINQNVRSLNNEQREVFNVIYKWGRDFIKNLSVGLPSEILPFYIFLTGGAGVGKSHLIKTIFMSMTKLLLRHGGSPNKPRVLLLAPTGVAAININGTTIHSGLGIVCGRFLPLNDKTKVSLRNKLSEIKIIIIDEISMVSSTLFFHLNQRLIEIFGCTSDLPFAGLSVIVCGDLYQLPPVTPPSIFAGKNSIKGLLTQDLWHKFCIAELNEVMRQKGDMEFINLLNKVRVGNIDEEVDRLLIPRFVDLTCNSYPHDALHIYAENIPANEHNNEMLNKLETFSVTIYAEDKIPKGCDLSEREKNSIAQRKLSETGNLHSVLHLKIGARVMLTTNLDIEDRLINGQVGTVFDFRQASTALHTVYIKFDDEKAGLKAMNSDNFARQQQLVPISKHEVSFGLRKNKAQPGIKRTQFPLTLSWACTVHKVQGLSLSKGVISFTLNRQKAFNQGQMYVALSRITSLSNLYLIGKYSRAAIKVNNAAKVEYDRLRNERKMVPVTRIFTVPTSLTITLLNVRSLRKHTMDILCDKNMMDSDILCFTETQILFGFDTSDIESSFNKNTFQIQFNNSTGSKFESLAVLSNQLCRINWHSKFEGISIFNVSKTVFSNTSVTIALLYRQQNCSSSNFQNIVVYLVNQGIDIIMGDFNINFLDTTAFAPLIDTLHLYEQIVTEPTHLDGGLIDHVHIRKNLLINIDISTMVCNVYFTDHDSVKFSLTYKSL